MYVYCVFLPPLKACQKGGPPSATSASPVRGRLPSAVAAQWGRDTATIACQLHDLLAGSVGLRSGHAPSGQRHLADIGYVSLVV